MPDIQIACRICVSPAEHVYSGIALLVYQFVILCITGLDLGIPLQFGIFTQEISSGWMLACPEVSMNKASLEPITEKIGIPALVIIST